MFYGDCLFLQRFWLFQSENYCQPKCSAGSVSDLQLVEKLFQTRFAAIFWFSAHQNKLWCPTDHLCLYFLSQGGGWQAFIEGKLFGFEASVPFLWSSCKARLGLDPGIHLCGLCSVCLRVELHGLFLPEKVGRCGRVLVRSEQMVPLCRCEGVNVRTRNRMKTELLTCLFIVCSSFFFFFYLQTTSVFCVLLLLFQHQSVRLSKKQKLSLTFCLVTFILFLNI